MGEGTAGGNDRNVERGLGGEKRGENYAGFLTQFADRFLSWHRSMYEVWSRTSIYLNKPMKVVRKNAGGKSREVLLKEYFVTASLIALLKRVGAEAARMAKSAPQQEPALVRVRR